MLTTPGPRTHPAVVGFPGAAATPDPVAAVRSALLTRWDGGVGVNPEQPSPEALSYWVAFLEE